MSLTDIRDKMQRGLDKRPLNEVIKFDCGADGSITLQDGQAVLEDRPAQCTIHMTADNLRKLIQGKMNPMTGFAMGKIRVSGDMALAMKLGQLLG
ncbi:SCP2 sterol-binding domain-containing protein [Sagittula sp. MA-2]|jgi:putative sterol carrier protein|uniref:SCP2 sterol-binding domain-containing protein n=1 Tax=Sagittula sp. MA-2 TaxID=3048007 RepID=UPI0024C39BEC|nr:SCP2 sterol-binding domain-containing protein [Sagittula sp. MA-2]WHZ35149.1 SCP2 sterol-binding domain-containing protein [Sagittula sp. MA-2]